MILFIFTQIGFSVSYNEIPFKYKFIYENIIDVKNELTYEEYESLNELFDIEKYEKEMEEKSYLKILESKVSRDKLWNRLFYLVFVGFVIVMLVFNIFLSRT